MHGWYEDSNNYYIVTDLVPGGELFFRIVEKKRFAENDARKVVRVLADTIAFIHERNYVHRDIKPENILLKNVLDETSIVLADFGFVTRTKRRGLTEACGTPMYVAPEVVSGIPYSANVDVWSLGIVIFIMLGGYHPFAAKKKVEMFRLIRKGELVFDPLTWSRISDDAKDLVSKCLAVDPSVRLTISRGKFFSCCGGGVNVKSLTPRKTNKSSPTSVACLGCRCQVRKV